MKIIIDVEYPEDFTELGRIAQKLEQKGVSAAAAIEAAPLIAAGKRWDDPLSYSISTSLGRNPGLKGFDQIEWYK